MYLARTVQHGDIEHEVEILGLYLVSIPNEVLQEAKYLEVWKSSTLKEISNYTEYVFLNIHYEKILTKRVEE